MTLYIEFVKFILLRKLITWLSVAKYIFDYEGFLRKFTLLSCCFYFAYSSAAS